MYGAMEFSTSKVFPAKFFWRKPLIETLRSKAHLQNNFGGKILHALNSII